MASINTDTLSPFGITALKLDQDFVGLQRLSGQLTHLDIDSDNGLEQAMKLLALFAQHGDDISLGMQTFANVLDQARSEAEAATAVVAERAKIVQARQQAQAGLQEKFNLLGSKAQEVNSGLVDMRKPAEEISADDKVLIHERLRSMDLSLGDFITEAQSIREEARTANFRKLERSAESLTGTLVSAHGKLAAIVAAAP